MVLQIPLPKIDYTARDFESTKAALVEYLKQRVPLDFTDFTESQLGIVLLEMFAWVSDSVHFMIDRMAQEVYLPTARERRSIIKQAALVGYTLSGPLPAMVRLDLDRDTLAQYDSSYPIIIAAGYRVDGGDRTFEIDQQYTITRIGTALVWQVNGSGAYPSPPIWAVEGETLTEQYTAPGRKFFQPRLARAPVIEGTVSVRVSNVEWTFVESLVLGDPKNSSNGQIYEVFTDEEDFATIRFGDGITGDIPSQGSQVDVEYRIGGGEVGNIAANVISGVGIPATRNNVAISLQATNTTPASGGSDRESLDHARFFVPQVAKTNDRAVTYADYFALCNGYSDGSAGTITKAGIVADPTDGISNVVNVYTWVLDANRELSPNVSVALRESLRGFLDQRRVVTVWVSVLQGTNRPTNITVLVEVDPSYDKQAVRLNVAEALRLLFQESRVRYGNELRYSWIHDTVNNVEGVAYSHVTVPSPQIHSDTARVLESGTLPNQGGSGLDQVILPPGSSAVDDFYCNYTITARGQSFRIIDYVGASRLATVTDDWTNKPIQNDPYGLTHPRRIRLAASASSTTNAYQHQIITITAGAGLGQRRAIMSYDGPSQVAFINKDWSTHPDATSVYRILPDIEVPQTHGLTAGVIDVQV